MTTPNTIEGALSPPASALPIDPSAAERTARRLAERHGEAHAEAIRRGVRQVAERWWREDGDEAAFTAFCEESFLPLEADRAAIFARLSEALEQIDGHLHEVRRELRRPVDLDTGPVSPADLLLADLDPSSHVDEDLFRTRVAFLALLHFPVHTLAERLELGASWDRETWARSRMMERFAQRVPASVHQAMTQAMNAAERYISGYYIRMDRLVTKDGHRLFPDGLRLITHWGLREELKAAYVDGPGGLAKQRMIQRVMERIVRQEIPEAVRDNPEVIWCPETNETRASADAAPAGSPREPDTRYARLLDLFRAARAADPYSPTAPTFIRRRFDLGRQMPEEEVEALLHSILVSEEVAALAREIERLLGRPLEPFDIWYAGFSSRGAHGDEELDAAVRARYPTKEALQERLPELLERLGFSGERARWLSDRIVIDAARGAGHAMPALRREDKVHLRTQATGGFRYVGFNIAMHELGHNVEQVFSLHSMDHWFLSGVPNVAFTEAMAFVFQSRHLEALGFAPEADARRRQALHALWITFEIAGLSMVDMRLWRWMYAHPDATPAELRDATLEIARGVWNRYFTPVFGVKDVDLLGIYSHIISSALYLPDYAIGQIVAFQVAARVRSEGFAGAVERMNRLGYLTPDAWMRAAVGGPVSARPLLDAAREAIEGFRAA